MWTGNPAKVSSPQKLVVGYTEKTRRNQFKSFKIPTLMGIVVDIQKFARIHKNYKE